jgi:DGQHR domain-containing protein
MRAADLRQLCDVYRRRRDGSNVEGIQRVRDESRTGRIRRYVQYGYPYGDLKKAQRTEDKASLRKPGWLPTAIVVNILSKGDKRRGKQVKAEHLIAIEDQNQNRSYLVIPPITSLGETELAPLEVIDGQHRLWAFDDTSGDDVIPDDFELPVIAFNGLDIAWQAYLFWSINVSPKKINPSHAFDLYPLLRTQEWLEGVGEVHVYREARAQELTEAMYEHPLSVWKARINMLGEKGTGVGVTQAGWVRSLLSTFLATGRGASRPGLFQSNLKDNDEPLEWPRSQQAAFLISLWIDVRKEIASGTPYLWIREYRSRDEAFTARTSMLNQDMGVRALSSVANDIFFSNAEEWELDRWFSSSEGASELDEELISKSLEEIEATKFRNYIRELASNLTRFDWRSFDGPNVHDGSDDAVRKRSYRGSGGYSSLRTDVLKSIAEDDGYVGRTARRILTSER